MFKNRYVIVSQGRRLHRIYDTQKGDLLAAVYEGKKPVEDCKYLNEVMGDGDSTYTQEFDEFSDADPGL